MNKHCYLLNIMVSATLLIFFCTASLFSGDAPPLPREPNEDTYFKLPDRENYIQFSRLNPNLEIIIVPFQVKYTGDVGPTNVLDIIEGKFSFPTSDLTYSHYIYEVTWNVDYFSVSDDPVSGYTTIDFTLDQGSALVTGDYQAYIHFVFYSHCAAEGTGPQFTFDRNETENRIHISGLGFKSPFDDDNWEEGSVVVADYTASFTIGDIDEAFLGEENITIPVSATTGFNMFGFDHQIQFSQHLLQLTDVIVNTNFITGDYTFDYDPDDGRVDVSLIYNDINQYIEEIQTPEKLYDLVFKVISDFDGFSTDIYFNTAGSNVHVFDGSDDGYCDLLDNCVESDAYNEGTLTVPVYEAKYTLAFTELNPDKSGPYDKLRYMLSLENNFPAGDPSGGIGISAVLGIQDYFAYSQHQGEDINPDIDLDHSEEFDDDDDYYMHIYQINGGYLDKCDAENPVHDLMELDFILDYSRLPYSERVVAPIFATHYMKNGEPAAITFVKDTTLKKIMYHEDLTPYSPVLIEVIGYEVTMGEFRANYASSQGVYVEQEIYVRNNFTLGSFTVEVSIGSDWCILCTDLEPGVSVQSFSGTHKRLYSNAFFDPLPPNGDQPTKIATFTYGVPHPCFGNKPQSTSLLFEDPHMYDDFGIEQYVATAPGGIHGYCDNYNGGCRADIIPPCVMLPPPPSKTIDDITLIPDDFSLHANRPNPFNPRTTLAYDVPVAEHVVIEVYNIIGQKVITLVDEIKAPGRHEVIWDGTDSDGLKVASGIYLYKMQAGEFTESRKMMLMK